MKIALMGLPQTIADRALATLQRTKRAATLTCPSCGASNRPGTSPIDLDEYDDARCEKCGDVWATAP